MTTNSDNLILTISDAAFGGKGLARLDGKVVFVPRAIPGDVVEARITREKGRYCDAELLHLVTPSPLRQPSPCAFADRCGGCPWLGVSYTAQQDWKRQFVIAALSRIGKFADLDRLALLTGDELLGYRNRIHLKGRTDPQGGLTFGYYQVGSHELVAIDRCQIAAGCINELLHNLAANGLPPLPGPLEFRFEIQEFAGQATVTLFPDDRRDGPLFRDWLERLRSLPGVAWAGLITETDHAPFLRWDEQEGVVYYSKPGQFQQVNMGLNRKLRALVRDHVEAVGARRILDLCCGSGNLSLGLIGPQREITGIESNPRAIACAAFNLTANALTGAADYRAEDAVAALRRLTRAKARYDLVLLDPPREGLREGMSWLKQIAPAHIVYVSCDPTTFARDLGMLCKKDYEVTRIVALDFFPNTFHVESVAFLRRVAMGATGE